MDPVDNGQGENQNNENAQEVTNADSHYDLSTANQTEEKYNPAWQEMMGAVPESLHPLITPHLKKWDDNFSQVQSRYAPYKPLLEKNIPYENIDRALQLAQIMNSQPELVYQELHNRYGQQSEQGQQENENEEQEEFEDDVNQTQYDLESDPRWIAQTQQLQAMQQFLQDQYQKEQDSILETEINNEWAALETSAGTKFDDDTRTEIINRAIAIADRDNSEPDLAKGYQSYQAFVSKVRNERANNTAPDVMGGSGGLPVQKVNYGKMSPNDRQNKIAAMVQALAEGNQ